MMQLWFLDIDLECPKPFQHGLFDTWKHHLKPFGLGNGEKPGEEEGHSVNDTGVRKAALKISFETII